MAYSRSGRRVSVPRGLWYMSGCCDGGLFSFSPPVFCVLFTCFRQGTYGTVVVQGKARAGCHCAHRILIPDLLVRVLRIRHPYLKGKREARARERERERERSSVTKWPWPRKSNSTVPTLTLTPISIHLPIPILNLKKTRLRSLFARTIPYHHQLQAVPIRLQACQVQVHLFLPPRTPTVAATRP
jgi:hypothetical protein